MHLLLLSLQLDAFVDPHHHLRDLLLELLVDLVRCELRVLKHRLLLKKFLLLHRHLVLHHVDLFLALFLVEQRHLGQLSDGLRLVLHQSLVRLHDCADAAICHREPILECLDGLDEFLVLPLQLLGVYCSFNGRCHDRVKSVPFAGLGKVARPDEGDIAKRGRCSDSLRYLGVVACVIAEHRELSCERRLLDQWYLEEHLDDVLRLRVLVSSGVHGDNPISELRANSLKSRGSLAKACLDRVHASRRRDERL